MMNEKEQAYLVALESAKTWNMRMMSERKMRQPYLDNTTGLAQTNCHLWMKPQDRQPGLMPGQIYSYPARRWRKKRWEPNQLAEFEGEGEFDTEAVIGDAITNGEHKMFDPVIQLNKTPIDPSKEKWFTNNGQYEEMDTLDDFEDGDDFYGDDSDYDDGPSRKRNKKKKEQGSSRGGTRKSSRVPEEDKPFSCEVCGSRYKTKQGLMYHSTHAHGVEQEEEALTPLSAPPVPEPQIEERELSTPTQKVPNDYCDFCLGDTTMNKKTKQPEEMVSCADCGRSGHPSCLQFTDNMKVSVIKYPWQCIECKSCGLCGTSENDDQLLFCDDCDRGYHMYCLKPPLTQPPEGNWSCHLCIAEFHGGVKPTWMS